ncbi:alanine racemase [Helicobacter sp. 13S00477-4]|uniref:alanine racemase n=1 Tax=Helicobacter sp. 13S00477-4 TaxID=1905759 RepID=UPI000BA71E2F|nr:alanine racemase [Helicobacter sp. 13S00477-4]PAF52714.1 alanine racemase [Helicobacter sp. 13S00477-4]
MSKILIDSQKFKNNLDTITYHIKDKNKLALVLKDNAYGHGIEQIALLAKDYGIKNVFVKNELEALKIAEFFEHITVLYKNISQQAPKNIHPSINTLEDIQKCDAYRLVELKINIGMNRNGIPKEELSFFIEKILSKKLQLLGVFAHNGYGDELGDDFDNIQKNFSEIKEEVRYLSKKMGFPLPRFHSLSSSGALRSSKIDDDLVRIGIAAYGYLAQNFSLPISNSLKPIASLWADKICEQKLPKGSKIGYGGKSVLKEDSIISTYDIGYGDGLFRVNENKAELKTSEGYPILPITSMDCFSCICQKEKVCVFDDVSLIAKIFDTIPYEILTHLSPFIQRSII